MRVEIPILKRCCFCLPLRRGLLFWAYVMLIQATLNLISHSKFLHFLMTYSVDSSFQEDMIDVIVFTFLETILIAPDIPFTIMFIVAAHRKNDKYFRIYYYYMMVSAPLDFLLQMADFIWFIYYINVQMKIPLDQVYIIRPILTSLCSLGVQVYMILLVRSEMIKLQDNCEFRFTNQAAEVECRMVPQVATIENEVNDQNNVKQQAAEVESRMVLQVDTMENEVNDQNNVKQQAAEADCRMVPQVDTMEEQNYDKQEDILCVY